MFCIFRFLCVFATFETAQNFRPAFFTPWLCQCCQRSLLLLAEERILGQSQGTPDAPGLYKAPPGLVVVVRRLWHYFTFSVAKKVRKQGEALKTVGRSVKCCPAATNHPERNLHRGIPASTLQKIIRNKWNILNKIVGEDWKADGREAFLQGL